jgi:hypothetical protein
VGRQRQVELHQLVDLVQARSADLETVGQVGLGVCRDLADPVRLLLTEAETEPRFDEGRIARRNERVMPVTSILNPALSCMRVEVADGLGFVDGMSGELDPDVRSPHLVVSAVAEEKADRCAIAVCDRSECAVSPELLYLGAEVNVVWEERFGLSVP